MWKRTRKPRKGDRRAIALDGSGLVTVDQWKSLRTRDAVWALEEHDGQLWHLQGVSDEATSAARFVFESRLTRR